MEEFCEPPTPEQRMILMLLERVQALELHVDRTGIFTVGDAVMWRFTSNAVAGRPFVVVSENWRWTSFSKDLYARALRRGKGALFETIRMHAPAMLDDDTGSKARDGDFSWMPPPTGDLNALTALHFERHGLKPLSANQCFAFGGEHSVVRVAEAIHRLLEEDDVPGAPLQIRYIMRVEPLSDAAAKYFDSPAYNDAAMAQKDRAIAFAKSEGLGRIERYELARGVVFCGLLP